MRAKAALLVHPAAIFAFDLLEIDELDERRRPLHERKRRLALVLRGRKRVKPAGHHENGLGLLAKAVRLELEGIVAKRADSIYMAGRSPEWLKINTPTGIEREHGRLAHLRQRYPWPERSELAQTEPRAYRQRVAPGAIEPK